MIKFFLTVWFLVCSTSLVSTSRDWRVQRLNQFQQKYNNSQADIIFLLDVSGSVSNAGFNTEKEFVKSLLSEISVQAIASRVAVVTFGKDVRTNIDYIGDTQTLQKNKCTFTREFARITHRYGPATNMNGALKEAQKILDEAKSAKLKRNHVNTVAFLLTDGYWNYGGNPGGTSGILRDRNQYDVELFSVGIGSFLSSQLSQVSDKSNVIIAKDFSDFEGLATRIRGDQIEKLYSPVFAKLCGITCDQHATCSCGTISGIYTCACREGYYGSGLPGRCHKCPHGTYKTYPSPDPCKPCPLNSITKQAGSFSINDCVCRPGFKGKPAQGEACKPVECPTINPSIRNGKVTSCGKYYQETCTFVCDKNHHIANEVATSRKIVCSIDGIWNRNSPQCVPVTCQTQVNRAHMTSTCSGYKVDDKCVYSCAKGYILVGANERTCKSDGQWSHSLPSCQAVTCPAVRKIDNVNIYPVSCMTRSTKFNDGCTYLCKSHFKRVTGNQQRVCQHDGTWSGTELECRDLTPPTISCPESIFAEAEPGQAYREIDYLQPTVIDNSISDEDEITIVQDPPTIKSPYEFPIGYTTINFTAIDQAGNSDSCLFRVEIVDREKPKFSYCPKDIKLVVDNPQDMKKLVSWKEPEFSDNSGIVTMSQPHPKNPKEINVGPPHLIRYLIQDDSKNHAECSFYVQIDPKTCPKQEPPINGAVSCSKNYIGDFCTVSCQNPYEFNGPMAYGYICGTNGKWTTYPPAVPFPWPDCTIRQPPEGFGQRMRFFYFTGSCKDSEATKNQIANNFVGVLNVYLRHDGGCTDPANAKSCDVKNVKVSCGKTQSVSGKYRRSTQPELKIEFELDMKSKETLTSQENSFKSVRSSVENVRSMNSINAKNLQHMTVGGKRMDLDYVESVGTISALCLEGQIFGTVKTDMYSNVKECVSCLAGSYFNANSKQCEQCPQGTYSENPGLLGCPVCPSGTTTASKGTSNSTQCRPRCDPGYYSKDGLVPCEKCPQGAYQPNRQSTSCVKCPGLTTTLEEGMKRQDDCRMKCPKGMFSKTSMEPCTPCPIGFYQPSNGKKQCIQCPNKLSTYGKGSGDVSECKHIDNCVSSPCLNGGICKNEWNDFSCTCKQGYRGKRCDVEKNECADKPCYGEAACVDKVNGFTCVCPVGYHGTFCSEKSPSCLPDHCQNGGTCGESPKGPVCSCKAGWVGKFCERSVNECESSPCANGGVCMDSHRGFTCICKAGFTGPRCMENIDDCEKNNLCKHGTCVDGIQGYTCSCQLGFAGEKCEVNIDECASNPCRNGALCVDQVNAYKCHCAAQFYGKNCEHRYTSNDFDLSFSRDFQGYAETAFYQDLSQFTVAFWMMTSSDDLETGTVLSYAHGNEEEGFQDNALVIRDPDHINVVVMGEQRATEISASDDTWHHIAITWNNKDGKLVSYKDGVKISDSLDFQKGRVIPANGIFILGQEQDEVGRNFSAGEAFHGKLSQFNLWNNVLAPSEIGNIASFRCDHVVGNVIAWPDFNNLTSDDVKREQTFCKVTNTKFSTWSSNLASPCPGRAVSAQCMTTNKMSIKQLNLIDTTCTSNGYSCGDQRKYDKQNTYFCPTDMMIRYECPYSPSNDCSRQSCSGRGSCLDTLAGYSCLCNDGFTGKNCESSVQCDNIYTIANGYVSTQGNKVHFSCKQGYKIKGASTLTCNGGRFNNAVPECVDVDECAQNPCSANSRCVNVVGSFKCDCLPGFKHSTSTLCVDINECLIQNGNCQDKCSNNQGSYTCKCRAGYQVSVDGRSCEDVNECESHDKNNCMQVCVNTRGGYKCRCHPGYNLDGDGKQCTPINCPQLNAPSNGKISKGNGSYKTKVLYTCNSKYRLNGADERVCQANGQWSGEEPVCDRVSCGRLPSPHNGQAILQNDIYTFKCLSGYRLVGSSTRKCQDSGDWDGTQPRCIVSRCPSVTAPTNGMLIGSSFGVNSALMVKCDYGFMLKDKSSAYLLCQADGTWSSNNIECIAINCGTPDVIPNGAVTGTSYYYNDKITYHCNSGYGLSGNNVRTCQLNGDWSGIKPTCLYNSCGYPGFPSNGNLISSDYSFGKTVSFTCNAGYRLIGHSTSQCQTSGQWSRPVPQCQEILCSALQAPTGGEKTGDKYGVNSTVRFDCLPGYSIKGQQTLKCKSDGTWDEQVPTCVSGLCGSSKLVGPSGSIKSRNYPNSYNNNEYCRWKIVVAQSKKAALDITSFKTQINDIMEVRDGKSGNLLNAMTGAVKQPLQITSSSNELDIIFHSDSANTADGFQANYFASTCGGQITSFGQVIETPGYPSHYGVDLRCSWQIVLPGKKFIVKFERFNTYDNHDTLEAWSHLTKHSRETKIGVYYGNRGSFLEIRGSTTMYLKFTSDSYYGNTGFRGTVVKDDSH